jgi:hypothetical protein
MAPKRNIIMPSVEFKLACEHCGSELEILPKTYPDPFPNYFYIKSCRCCQKIILSEAIRKIKESGIKNCFNILKEIENQYL